jgi:RNA-directed DNA polymerase
VPSAAGGDKAKPETFDFLGFTHCCDQTRQGRFIVLRLSSRKKVHAKLLAVQEELRRRMHRPIEEQGQYLRAVVGGHMRYYGVPRNAARLKLFRWRITQLWHRTLCRRTQVRPIRWARVAKIAEHWLPPRSHLPPVSQPTSDRRTRGKSRMR